MLDEEILKTLGWARWGWGSGQSSSCPGESSGEGTSSAKEPEEAPSLGLGAVGSATDLLCSLVWGTVLVFASVSPTSEDGPKVPSDGPTNGGAEPDGVWFRGKGLGQSREAGSRAGPEGSRVRV